MLIYSFSISRSLFLSLRRPLWSNGTNEWVTPRCAHRTLVNRVVSPLRAGLPLLSRFLSISLRAVYPDDIESEKGCSTAVPCAGRGRGLRVGALVHRYRKGWTPLPASGEQEFTRGVLRGERASERSVVGPPPARLEIYSHPRSRTSTYRRVWFGDIESALSPLTVVLCSYRGYPHAASRLSLFCPLSFFIIILWALSFVLPPLCTLVLFSR